MSSLNLILGKRGKGKSTLLKTIVLEHARARPDLPWLVWDTTAEWSVPPWADPETFRILPGTQWTAEDAAELAIELADPDDWGGAVLVMDELDRAAHCRKPPPAGSALYEVIHMGRHVDVALIAAARRPSSLATDVQELIDVAWIHGLSGRNDMTWVRDTFGKEVAERVSQLADYEWLRVDP